jgi:hypothetical protein
MSHFSTWIEISKKEKSCSYSTRTKRLIYDFSRIFRASRVPLIPTNSHLIIEENHIEALERIKG